jgi:excisionase family DNA binding protein
MSYTPQAFTVLEFAKRNGIGHDKVYAEIRAGRLVARKSGRRTLIFEEAERAWREALPMLVLPEKE